MTEKNPDNPFPDDNPSFEDVSPPEDENEVTVILPEEITEDVGSDITEEVPDPDPDCEKTGEVFVLLPDGDDSQIPMVETQEVPDVTEDIEENIVADVVADVEAPHLTSVYEATTASHEATASQVGMRTDNPAHEQAADTEIDPFGEPTEESVATDQPTETMSAGDLDDFANEVADDMLGAEGGEPSVDQDPTEYEDEGFYDQDETLYEDQDTYAPSGEKRLSFKNVALSLAALIAIAATGVHFFPGYVGLDPSFDLKEFVMGHIDSLSGGPEVVSSGDPVTPPGGGDADVPDVPDGGPPTPPSLAMVAQETFKGKFEQAIELGFGEAPR